MYLGLVNWIDIINEDYFVSFFLYIFINDTNRRVVSHTHSHNHKKERDWPHNTCTVQITVLLLCRCRQIGHHHKWNKEKLAQWMHNAHWLFENEKFAKRKMVYYFKQQDPAQYRLFHLYVHQYIKYTSITGCGSVADVCVRACVCLCLAVSYVN